MPTQSIQRFLQTNNYPTFCPKAFFFDMDGILFDSMSLHAPAWVQAFKDYNFEFSEYEAYMNEGRTGRSTIDLVYKRILGRPATDEEKNNVYNAKSAYFHANEHPNIIPNVSEVLHVLRKQGKEIFVVTGSAEKSLFKALDRYFPTMFDPTKMVTAYDVKIGKPHPEPYLIGLEKSGVSPWEGVVIENAPLGVQSGRDANMFTIAINTGILDDKELIDAGAHLVLPNMQALLEIIHLF